MPKFRTETFGGGDQSWLGSTHGIGNARTGTIDISTFTAATHYPAGHIPSGTLVDCANEGAIKPYVDGAAAVLGILLTDQTVIGTADFAAPILRHGIINVGKLPKPWVKPATGNTAGFTFVGGN